MVFRFGAQKVLLAQVLSLGAKGSAGAGPLLLTFKVLLAQVLCF